MFKNVPLCALFAGSVLALASLCTEAAPAEVDPLLKKAWEYFNDYENRNRATSIQLFEDYMTANPKSPHIPEINFWIGNMYGVSNNEEKGETCERDLMWKYWKKAKEGYGDYYSPKKDCAWASLVSHSRSVAEMMKYHDWLLELQARGTWKDMYPYSRIFAVVKTGRPAKLSEQERRTMFNSVMTKQFEEVTIAASAGNMLAFAGPKDLEVLAKKYAGSKLGRKAARRIERIRQGLSEQQDSLGDPKGEQTAEL